MGGGEGGSGGGGVGGRELVRLTASIRRLLSEEESVPVSSRSRRWRRAKSRGLFLVKWNPTRGL